MPLVERRLLSPGVVLGLWRLDESEADVKPLPGLDLSGIRGTARRLERWAAHLCLEALTQKKGLIIEHDKAGKPLLEGYFISISHTHGWLAMVISQQSEVAVDIEYISERVSRVASHFLRPDEPFIHWPSQLVAWCAKETVYKYFSAEHLASKDIRVRPFEQKEQGEVVCDVLPLNASLRVGYECTPDYYLTYALPST